MRIYDVPAKYAPELVGEIQSIVRRIHQHMEITGENAADPLRQGFILDKDIDSSRTGSVVIVVAEYPDDAAASVFPHVSAAKVA